MIAPLTPHDEFPPDPRRQPPAGNAAFPEEGPPLRVELRSAALVAVAVTLAGVLLGLLWFWLAPRVPLVSDGKAVFFKNSEGEEAVGADGTFVLLALGAGVLTAVVISLLFRRGGIPVVIALAVGGMLGSVLAWQLGGWLGPATDVAAHARAVGKGVAFDAPLQLRAKGALLVWPLVATAVHLGLTALFGPRDPEPFHGPGHLGQHPPAV